MKSKKDSGKSREAAIAPILSKTKHTKLHFSLPPTSLFCFAHISKWINRVKRHKKCSFSIGWWESAGVVTPSPLHLSVFFFLLIFFYFFGGWRDGGSTRTVLSFLGDIWEGGRMLLGKIRSPPDESVPGACRRGFWFFCISLRNVQILAGIDWLFCVGIFFVRKGWQIENTPGKFSKMQ